MTKPVKDGHQRFKVLKKKTETKTSWLLDIDGDEVWVPKTVCSFDEQEMSIEMPEWLIRKVFPNG